jgi:hypothetical protein
MGSGLANILTVSVIAMSGELVYRLITRRGRILPRLAALAVAIGITWWLAPGPVEKMGSTADTVTVIVCYLAMLLGMMAEYGYAQAEKGYTHFKFEPLSFLMPIFASPIVFIPLVTLTSDLGQGGAFTRAKLMVYLVAFQNGFFWRSFFEERRRHAAATPATPPAST